MSSKYTQETIEWGPIFCLDSDADLHKYPLSNRYCFALMGAAGTEEAQKRP
jgi:hypothetical protein